MSDSNKVATLTEIATDILIAELKRRAAAKGMTTTELVIAAGNQWKEAEHSAEDLLNAGHDVSEQK